MNTAFTLAQSRPTKRAPDAGDSAAISSSFLRLIIFPVGRLRRPRPSAGNANRWAAGSYNFRALCLCTISRISKC